MPTRRFLLLCTRSQDELAIHERHTAAQKMGVPEEQVELVRLDQGPLGPVTWEDYAGVLLGGSPFTTLTPPSQKTPAQLRVEAELEQLLTEVLERDVPFLGLCFGTGTLGRLLGGTVDGQWAEPTSAPLLEVTEEGRADPILAGVPEVFQAFVGHKEALSALPPGATLLVRGQQCPFQLWRVGTRQYVSQFHPEADPEGLVLRMAAYLDSGYFAPEEFTALAARMRAADVADSHRILANFARLCLDS